MRDPETFGQNARRVIGDASAGDVRGAFEDFFVVEGAQGLEVTAVQLQEFLGDGGAQFVELRVHIVAGDFEEKLAGQRVAVGVEAGGGQAEQHVAGLDGFAGDHALPLDHAHDEAGQVVFAVVIEAGHFGGFAADERASVLFAAAGDAGDDRCGDAGVEFAGGEVIEKEERQSALHGDVVDAVIHQIFADGGVAAGEKSELELGADAVGGGDQDGLAKALQKKASAEAADVGEDAFR